MKKVLVLLFSLAWAGLFTVGLITAEGDSSPPEGVQVEARGPVHEAYAEPTETRAAPGIIVAKQPPEPVAESPPEEKPEGDNVSWIPGYWAWDEDSSDFLWVSGFWREEPPGRDWVPGEWHRVEGGYQWVSGYWAPENQAEVDYLPAPPESLERGPAVPAPGEDYVYIPGNWIFQETRYLWQPGHWGKHHPGWVWTPACYRYTPAGYVFIQGFWDRPLAERGLLFAPVRFPGRIVAARTIAYTPSYVVNPDSLIGSLFVRAKTRQYYFGDYYDEGYRKQFVPWFDYRVNSAVHDANYAYYRTAFARHKDWDKNLRTLYQARYSKEVPRPPRTLVQQTKVINNITQNKTINQVVNKNINITNVQNVSVVQPIRKVTNVRVTALASLAHAPPAAGKTPAVATPLPKVTREVKVQQVRKEHLVEETKQVQRYRAIAQERKTREAKIAARPAPAKPAAPAPVRVKPELPKSVPAPRVRTPVKPPPAPVHPRPDATRPGVTPPPKSPPAKTPPPPKGRPKDKDKGK